MILAVSRHGPGPPKREKHPGSWRQPGERVGGAHQLAAAVGAALDLDLALGEPLRPDQDLPGDADQVGGREFRDLKDTSKFTMLV